MAYDFPSEVQKEIGPMLLSRGFTLDAIATAVDEGGRRGSVVYYRRDDCKVQVYLSARDGEVNAMIAPTDAPNELGAINRSRKWRYFKSFAQQPQLPLEELVRMVPMDFASDEDRLEALKLAIEKNFAAAHDWVTNVKD